LVGILAWGAEVGFVLETTTPLFQTNLFPDLMQVNFFPEAIEVVPALLQVAPAFTAPIAGEENQKLKKVIETTRARVFFTVKWYLAILDLSALSSRIGSGSST
jgi:hypothetical protein